MTLSRNYISSSCIVTRVNLKNTYTEIYVLLIPSKFDCRTFYTLKATGGLVGSFHGPKRHKQKPGLHEINTEKKEINRKKIRQVVNNTFHDILFDYN